MAQYFDYKNQNLRLKGGKVLPIKQEVSVFNSEI